MNIDIAQLYHARLALEVDAEGVAGQIDGNHLLGTGLYFLSNNFVNIITF